MSAKQFLRSREAKALAFSLPGALFIIFFLFLPLATIVVYSFWRTESYTMIVDWNLNNYLTILTTKTYLTFLLRSLVMSLAVSFISLVYSWPVSTHLDHADRRTLFYRHSPAGHRHATDSRSDRRGQYVSNQHRNETAPFPDVFPLCNRTRPDLSLDSLYGACHLSITAHL